MIFFPVELGCDARSWSLFIKEVGIYKPCINYFKIHFHPYNKFWLRVYLIMPQQNKTIFSTYGAPPKIDIDK